MENTDSKSHVIGTGYVPRVLQNLLHRSLKRFNVLVCHRRFGKTVFAINELLDQALRNTRKNPHYAYVAPTYSQAKRVAWEYFKQYALTIPTARAVEGDLRLEIERPATGDIITVWLLGAENPDSIRGMYLDGVIIDEYAQCDPIIWQEVVRPALSDRMGWIIFIGTVKGVNHFWRMYEMAKDKCMQNQELGNHCDWFAYLAKASETGIIPKKELDDARTTMSEDLYLQEFECDPSAALVGAYYGEQMREAEKSNRITSVPYDPAVPVDTYWDLGIGDTTAIWYMQQVGQEIHAIDYTEMSGKGLDYYVKILKEKPYVYGEHYLPHDAEARELGTGRTRVETITAHGLRPIRVVRKQRVEDGINASRLLLSRTWFDKNNCSRGILALKNYEKKWDERNQIFLDSAKHNWASHGSDAYRTFAMGMIPSERRRSINNLPRKANTSYNVFGGV
jgi:phage terminase large subunit